MRQFSSILKYAIVLLICIFSLSSISLGQQRSASRTSNAVKLNWNVHLYEQNDDFIQITFDTTKFPPETCFSNFTFKVTFLDKHGRRHQHEFTVTYDKLKDGKHYVDWLPQPFKEVQSAEGTSIEYVIFNCGTRFTRLKGKGIGEIAELPESEMENISAEVIEINERLRIKGSKSGDVDTSGQENIIKIKQPPIPK